MVTVLTPAYNRANTLDNLYYSLQQQTNKNFEWIIIDDGSSDATSDKIEEYKKNSDFDIVTAFQVNQGKPSAINHGCRLSRCDYILIVDSDDCLTNDAIEWVLKGIKEAEAEGIEYSGVGFRKSEFNGTLSGIAFDNHSLDHALYLNATDASNLLKGEMAFCFKRDLMLKIPFPLHAGEKFVPEGLIWTQITDFACVRFYINKIIYLYGYLDDGLTMNFKKHLKNNYRGFSEYYRNQFYRESDLLKKGKMLVRYIQCKYYGMLK